MVAPSVAHGKGITARSCREVRSLKVGAALRQSLATTNGLESIFALVEQRTGKVDRWRNSNQKRRWRRQRYGTLSRGAVDCVATASSRNCGRH